MLQISDMDAASTTFKTQMLDRIGQAPQNMALTPSDFLDLAGRDAIDKTLQRLVKWSELRRIDRGLYDKPRFNNLTQRDSPPDPKAVINAVARRDQIRVLVDGMTAANDLGFTNAVPARIVVHSEARAKSIKLGNLSIIFKQTAASKLYWAGRPAMRVVQALHWLRDTMAGDDGDSWRHRLAALLTDSDHAAKLRADLASGMTTLPAWMQDTLSPLVFSETHVNGAFDEILRAAPQTRNGLFTTTAQRLGTTPAVQGRNLAVESPRTDPTLLGRYRRHGFSRRSGPVDIDKELTALSRKKREALLDDIRAACGTYINGPLTTRLTAICAETCERTNLGAGALQVKPDAQDRQTLIIVYPSATPTDSYIVKSVKIESGAKSALDPNSRHTIVPYIDADVSGLDLAVQGITLVDAGRAFWDKVVILHGLRRWYDIRGQLRGNGQRISRHYYDVFRLLRSEAGQGAMTNTELGRDCVAHARMFFNRPDFDLASATPPTFALSPERGMIDDLRQNYRAMSAMIFGKPPAFEAVIEAVAALQTASNAIPKEAVSGDLR